MGRADANTVALGEREAGRAGGKPERFTIGVLPTVHAGALGGDEVVRAEIAPGRRGEAGAHAGGVARGQPGIDRRTDAVRLLIADPGVVSATAALAFLAVANPGAALVRAAAGSADAETPELVGPRLRAPISVFVFPVPCRDVRMCRHPQPNQAAHDVAARRLAGHDSRQGGQTRWFHARSFAARADHRATRAGRRIDQEHDPGCRLPGRHQNYVVALCNSWERSNRLTACAPQAGGASAQPGFVRRFRRRKYTRHLHSSDDAQIDRLRHDAGGRPERHAPDAPHSRVEADVRRRRLMGRHRRAAYLDSGRTRITKENA